jgi:stage III sporulation protein AG
MIYQTNTNTSNHTDSYSEQNDVVTVSDGNRGEAGLVRQVIPPKYMGAVVVCQGADHPAIRLAVVEAVSDLTGLGADRVSVLKMK